MNQIENVNWIDEKVLDQEQYFQSLFGEVCRRKLLSDSQITRIQQELVELMAKEVERFNNNESSSIRVETAGQILQSICYSIGAYLKTVQPMDTKLDMLKTEKIKDLFYRGIDKLDTLFKNAKAALSILQAECLRIDNIAYLDTLFHGLPDFFHDYEMEFSAFDNPGSIDYQLCNTMNNITGVEYIDEYIRRVKLENDFCRKFPVDNIEMLLMGYSKDSKQLLINIYELVITNVLGCRLLGKDIYGIDIRQEEIAWLQSNLENMTTDDLQECLMQEFKVLCQEMGLGPDHYTYGLEAIRQIAVRLQQNLTLKTLKQLFIAFPKEEQLEEMIYEDGFIMDDERLREFMEEVRDCSLLEDKITLVKNEVRSLNDLIEIMEECFYGDEFYEVFKLLSNKELELLKKNIEEEIEVNNIKGVNQLKEWQERLLQYTKN